MLKFKNFEISKIVGVSAYEVKLVINKFKYQQARRPKPPRILSDAQKEFITSSLVLKEQAHLSLVDRAEWVRSNLGVEWFTAYYLRKVYSEFKITYKNLKVKNDNPTKFTPQVKKELYSEALEKVEQKIHDLTDAQKEVPAYLQSKRKRLMQELEDIEKNWAEQAPPVFEDDVRTHAKQHALVVPRVSKTGGPLTISWSLRSFLKKVN